MKLSEFSLLTDENIQEQVVGFLRSMGFNVLDVKEEGLFAAKDRDLLQLASQEGRVVVTHDSDFGTLVYKEAIPFVGIIYLRPGHIQPEYTITSIVHLLSAELEVSTPFIIVAEHVEDRIKLRIRHFDEE